jgi:penicillin-binding protein 1A
MFKSLNFYFKLFLISTIICISIVGYLFYFCSKDLPTYDKLLNYHPPSVTRIYSTNGKLIEEYALERRIFVPISKIPKSLIDAFIAAEDKTFFTHSGINITAIFRSALISVSNILQKKRAIGGSTITQQVVKNFLLTPEYSIIRKIKEAILAYRISKALSKLEILELYLNQLYMGKSSYGVAVAAQIYFNKSIDELNLAESAFLAGLPKAPSVFDPEKNYERSKQRRDYVINRMFEDGYITKQIALDAINTPITIMKRKKNDTISAPYYAEKVRNETIRLLGHEIFYEGGLTIITPLEEDLQQHADIALRNGLRQHDRKQNIYVGPLTTINSNNWKDELTKISTPNGLYEYELAVILDISDSEAIIGLKNDLSQGKINISEMKWAKSDLKSAKNMLNIGDVIIVEKLQKKQYALRQIPKINGAMLIVNTFTGQVLAHVGGYDFSSSKFDRATQALRQPGSLIKPFVYLAALENGIMPNQIFEDGPIEIDQGPFLPKWQPKNYKGDFLGNITMRTALEKSRNLVTVRIAETIGLSKVAEIINRFNINKEPNKLYSMVLGSLESTLENMTIAFATLGNSGEEVKTHFIETIKDRNGKIIYKRDNNKCPNCNIHKDEIETTNELPIITEIKSKEVTDEANAYQITSFLTGVIDRGTATSAKKLGKIIAGKTGTTNNSFDTWFVGFTPRITVGTYVGYDIPKTLGKTATGSSVALPIFIDFMKNTYKEKSIAFKVPDNIKFVPIDIYNGKLSKNSNFMEIFKNADPILELESDEEKFSKDLFEIY